MSEPRYFYAIASFDESLPLYLREAIEALAKARALGCPRDRFDVLEANALEAQKRAYFEQARSKNEEGT